VVKQYSIVAIIGLLSQPSDYCTAWDEDVNHNPDSMKEANAFLYGQEMQSVLRSVSRRLGTNITNGMYVLFGSIRDENIGRMRKLLIRKAIPCMIQILLLFLFRMKLQIHLSVPTLSPKAAFSPDTKCTVFGPWGTPIVLVKLLMTPFNLLHWFIYDSMSHHYNLSLQ
jgi:hypothetical protein